ncbi:MAG: cobalamin biosynthesis protein CobD [Treponema sp.]|nr:cobalamin biosynthesis protein CobD [Treponema sp.]
MCYQCIAARSLCHESMKVYHKLKKGSLEEARKAVSMIVGRDTDILDEKGVAKAAVETVAENTSDGVVAPIFYMALFGACGGMVYKAINTMDSMIAYKNEKYLHFGFFAAKVDDLANLIPSRLSALLMIFSSLILSLWPARPRFNAKNAAKIFIRDRYKHASPNSAQTESVMAGSLGLRLAGDTVYGGVIEKKEFIGDGTREIEAKDIIRSNILMYATGLNTVFLALLYNFL